MKPFRRTFFRTPRGRLFLWAVALFVFALVLNILTPLAADDYGYYFSYATDEPVCSVLDICRSLAVHYNVGMGRLVPHFFVQLFMWQGKALFNVFNAAMLPLLTLLIYEHIRGNGPHRVMLYPVIAVFLWFLLPDFGFTALFLSGACNYLWSAVFLLAFLLPFRLYVAAPRAPLGRENGRAAAMLVAGFFCGWLSENMSGGAVLLILLCMGILYRNGQRIPRWFFAGLIGCAVGLILMVSGPGNQNRLGGTLAHLDKPLLFHLASLLLYSTRELLSRALPLLASLIVPLALGTPKRLQRSSVVLAAAFAFTALAMNYVVLLSLEFPLRAQFGPVVFLLIAAGMLYLDADVSYRVSYAPALLLSVALCLFSVSASKELNDLGAIRVEVDAREQIILSEKAAGNLDVTVPKLSRATPYSALYIGDISADPDNWINRGMSRYFRVRSIQTE